MDRRRQRAQFASLFSIFFITIIVFVWSLQAGPLPIIVEAVLIGAMVLLALRGRRMTAQLRRTLRRVFWLFFIAITISVVVWVFEVGPLLPIVVEAVLLTVALVFLRGTRSEDESTLES